ncbi:PD-(D/E)XK nuclease family protein [Bifidobacterium sp. SO1]|uniref:RecB family exonuclease n=1 Tax=Bifidobacterium sp. SO1 TaxID=2809029 RepID=UPI001BDC4B79|nr:PD-(D/E)XK nuclease family protein [Bifidobacterium sp. SO1]MBT1161853.1 PD-(D/E)XK nuclease family protein [Bifidobacterium sp. SO1]
MSVDPVIVFDESSNTLYASVSRPVRASFTMLDQWHSCPGRWVGDRLLPKPREWGDPLTLGSLAHAALELACGHPEKDDPDWRALCALVPDVERERNRVRGWGSDPIPDGVLMPDGRIATEEDWVRAATGKLSGFRLSDALGRPLTPKVMEQSLEADLDGIPFRGAVDYRDSDGSVVDWKTGHVPAWASGRERHADQLRVYRMLLNAHDVDVRMARDVYVESRAWADADLSDRACGITLDWMRDAWDGLQTATGVDGSGGYALRPSGLCGWCPLALACPVARIRSAKARLAASNSVTGDDPRVGFRRTHAPGWNKPHKGGEEHMVDLLSLIGGVDEPTDTEKPVTASKPVAESKPATMTAGPAPDPWLSEAGRKAMDKWGVTQTVTEEDPWAQPMTPATPAPVTPAPAEDAVKPADAQPVASGEVRLAERRPYDPTIGANGMVNTAGYGFTQYMMLCAYATLLADTHKERVTPIRDLLLDVEWRMARDAFGMIVPDVPGLADGTPERGPLFTWLDSTLARDADRVLRMLLDARPPSRDGVSDSLDATLDRIRECGRMGGNVLRLTADRLRA